MTIRAIVIASSDHGEAWGEHGSYTHTFDLYAEQVDVPFWIDAPEGTLTWGLHVTLAARWLDVGSWPQYGDALGRGAAAVVFEPKKSLTPNKPTARKAA